MVNNGFRIIELGFLVLNYEWSKFTEQRVLDEDYLYVFTRVNNKYFVHLKSQGN